MTLPQWFDGLGAADPVADIRAFLRVKQLATLRHVTQVAAAGRRLARRCGLPLAPVTLACLAHDLAAVVPPREMIAVAEQLGVRLSPADYAIPQVVHGPVAAAVLAHHWGVADEPLLNAVRYHTTLRAGATLLEKLVFIADKIALDPTSHDTGFHPALLAVRHTASLDALCLIYLNWVVHEAPQLGWRVHPNAAAAQAELARGRD